jgi:CDP-diacylglycerol--glycerol-3-phosphate 3-phosphatidyltransferase
MNLPNKLTVFRILLVPIIVILAYINIPGEVLGISTKFIIIDAIFIIASITDKLDGYLARKLNKVTNFGKFLDPIADKILVISVLLLLTELQKIPAWISIVVIFREFLVSGYRLVAAQSKGTVIAASMWGKVKTTIQMIVIMLVLLDPNNFFDFAKGLGLSGFGFYFNIVTSVAMCLAVIATIFSGWDYLRQGKDLFKDK